MDGHSIRINVAGRAREKGELFKMLSRLNGKLSEGLTEDECRHFTAGWAIFWKTQGGPW